MTSAFAPLLVATLCCVASAPSWAQTRYVCRDAAGNSFTMSRPCPSGTTTSVAATGPLAPPPAWRYEPPVRSVPEGPAYQRYMSARCRSLSDTLRGGSSGIQPDAYAGMRREYQRDCRDEESDASSRYYREQSEARKQQQQEQEQQLRVAAQASREEATRHAEQCRESRRILTAKRARTDLTEGERKDLKRFEDAYETRCQR